MPLARAQDTPQSKPADTRPAETSESDDDDADHDDRGNGHDFLFSIEPAYTQECGEVQVSFHFGFLTGRETERQFEFQGRDREIETERSRYNACDYVLELEYGLTDRFQISVELPYAYVRSKSRDEGVSKAADFGDAEFALAYAWLKDGPDSVELTTAFSLALPTGNYVREIGYERVGYGGSLAVSKLLGRFATHANIGYEYVPNARLRWANGRDGPPTDLHEFSYGAACTYDVTPGWQLMLEVAGETGHELELDGRAWETELLLTPGMSFHVNTEHLGSFIFGVGVPIGLTSASSEWGVFAQVQWEFELDD